MAQIGTIRAGTSVRPGEGDTRLVELWLIVVAALIALTAVIGAATRLTGSGLSITEWQPIMGIVPPLTEAQWHEAFEKYKQIPQYTEINRGMSLAAFKVIFAWEWGHRLVARAIGVVFLVPFVWFAATRRIPHEMVPRLVVLFVLGGLQGAIGWFMVMSGLSERVSVSPYRLSLHLGCAVLILAVTVWTVLDLRARRRPAGFDLATVTTGQMWLAAAVVGLVYLQILSGALVAGLKAGMTYNTWPLMDGRLFPVGLGQLSPWWLNLFENITTVQFNHRMIAYAVVGLGLWQAASAIRTADNMQVRRSGRWLGAALVLQMALGIWTLLAWVPVSLGVAHQGGALAVLAIALWHLHAVRRAHGGHAP
ncbi:MAG: COX15/CtaA family protein [Hyphomicrobiaceae bacterium]|nr:COX15/CtaA family protein [Hyphomicrobiaceae bacterium]